MRKINKTNIAKRNSYAAGVFNIFIAFGPCTALYYYVKKNMKNGVLKVLIGSLIALLEYIYIGAGIDCIKSAIEINDEFFEDAE